MLPTAHNAYSATSGYLLLKVVTNKGIPPLSTIECTYVVVPEHIFVKPQADSNYKWGSLSFFKYDIIYGTRFLSITT